MKPRAPFAPSLAAIILAAGVLQVLAVAELGRTPISRLIRASHSSSLAYIIGGLALGVVALAAWKQRSRPRHAAGVIAIGLVLTAIALRSRVSMLGAIYHGEFILHHFTTLLASAVCLLIPISWSTWTGGAIVRRAPVVLATLGIATLLAHHIGSATGLLPAAGPTPVLQTVGTVCMISSWLAALATRWRSLGPPRLRALAAILATVVLIRIGLAAPDAELPMLLAGQPLASTRALPLAAAMTFAGVSVFVLLRNRVRLPGKLVAILFALAITVKIHSDYTGEFGRLEGDLGGLAGSLLGFELPYPDYVPLWILWSSLIGVFLLVSTAVTALFSAEERDRGVAVALIAIAGLGLSNPQLVLMQGAAFWLLLDTLTSHGGRADYRAPAEPLEPILETFARRVGVAEPVNLEQQSGSVIAVRGELAVDTEHSAPPVNLDVRARSRDGRRWTVRVEIGVIGRSRPLLELRPDPGAHAGQDSPLITTAHRVRGEARLLEHVDDGALDELAHFPVHRTAFWDAGVRVDLGADLTALDAESLTALARALARFC